MDDLDAARGYDLLWEVKAFCAGGLLAFYAARVALFDDIGGKQPCVPAPSIKQIMGLRALSKGLASRIRSLSTVLVVEIDRTLLHRDQEQPGMAVPASAPARPHDKILMKDLRLALRFQYQFPVGPGLNVLLDGARGTSLSQHYVGHDPVGLCGDRAADRSNDCRSADSKAHDPSHDFPLPN